MSAPTLSDIIALRNERAAAHYSFEELSAAYDRAINDALASDFPRHRRKFSSQRHWDVLRDVSLYVQLGYDRDDTFLWTAWSFIGGLRRSHATGPTPYAAVLAALDSLSDAEARDALRAAVEATR